MSEYLSALEESKAGRPEQVRDGLQAFVELWRRAIENGVVSEDDDVELALEKIEAKGGLYAAAGD